MLKKAALKHMTPRGSCRRHFIAYYQKKACDAPRMPSIMAMPKRGVVSTGRAVWTVEMSRGPMVLKTPTYRVWSKGEGIGFNRAMAMSRLRPW